MPVYLPPISRRRFLAQAAVAGAGLMLPSCLFVAKKPEQDPEWVFLSDTHIAADPATVSRGQNVTVNLTAAVRAVLALPRSPAGVIVNGDLAFRNGEAGDYRAFVELVRPLREAGLPVILALGNHDNREAFRATVPQALGEASPVVGREVMLVRTPRVNWFVLDSLDKTRSSPGRLGEEQLRWLARELDANRRRPAVVVVHHHPDKGGDKIALLDTPELLAVIRPRRQVKAYIFGHTHAWSVQQDPSGLHLINLPPTSYLFAPGHPIGWVRTKIESGGMQLELRSLDPAHPQPHEVVNLSWRNET